MSNEIQILKDVIAERVGKELVNLIPKDQWEALIQQQINQFMSATAPAIIKEELTRKLKEDIAKHIPQEQWDISCQEYVNPLVQEIITKAAPEIMGAMLHPVMSGVISQLRSMLQNGRGY